MIGFTAGFALLQTEGQHGNKARPEEISGGRYEAQNQNSRRQDPTQPQRLGSSDGRIGADLREHGSRHPYRFDECAVIEIPRTARPGADAASRDQEFIGELIATTDDRIPNRRCEERRITMKLQTRIKAGRPGPNHNTIVR